MKMPLLLLGVGQVGMALARRCRDDRRVIGTTRNPQKLFDLFHERIEPIVMPWPSAEVIAPLAEGAEVVVSFPPDGKTDAVLAPGLLQARSVVYVSSTVVYGTRQGTIDDTTPVFDAAVSAEEPPSLPIDKIIARVEAEKIWRSIGANVVRAPAIYGPDDGLHQRLLSGSYKLPGDGTNVVSRIHIDDLASLILALLDSGRHGETYVVGDLQPAFNREVVGWLCAKLNLPLPETVPLEAVHYTQASSRAIDGSRALRELNVELQYPTYREGFQACLDAINRETA